MTFLLSVENKQKASLYESPRLRCARKRMSAKVYQLSVTLEKLICLPPSLQKVANLAPVARCMVRANHMLKGIVGNPYVSMVVSIG